MSRPEQVRSALIGLGANLGDRQATLTAAVAKLRRHPCISELKASSLYETEPVGFLDQPKFLNAVVAVKTSLDPEALLQLLMQIESEFGRERRERWGPRTLDLDLLDFAGEQRNSASLTLPHPRMLERAFVTLPLQELLNTITDSSGLDWHKLRERLAGSTPETHDVRWFASPEIFE